MNTMENLQDGGVQAPTAERKFFDRFSLTIIGGFILASAVIALTMRSGYTHSRNSALSDRYFAEREYERAVPYLQAILERYPGAWMRRKMLGDCFLMSKTPNPKAALAEYEKIQQDVGYQGFMANSGVSPQEKLDWDLNGELGICYSQLGDENKARGYFTKALELEPDDPASNYYRGVQLFNAGDYRQAAQRFQNAATGDHAVALEVNDTEAPRQASKWGDHWSKLAEPYRREIAKRVLGAQPPAPAKSGGKG